MNWNQETLKDDFECQKCCLNAKKESFLHRIVTADEKWTHYDNTKYICETWTMSQINVKTEYLWRQINALYVIVLDRQQLIKLKWAIAE